MIYFVISFRSFVKLMACLCLPESPATNPPIIVVCIHPIVLVAVKLNQLCDKWSVTVQDTMPYTFDGIIVSATLYIHDSPFQRAASFITTFQVDARSYIVVIHAATRRQADSFNGRPTSVIIARPHYARTHAHTHRHPIVIASCSTGRPEIKNSRFSPGRPTNLAVSTVVAIIFNPRDTRLPPR